MKTPKSADQPTESAVSPPIPDWETEYSDVFDQMAAQDAWSTAIRAMREAGTLSPANGPAIRRLADFTVAYRRASRQVAEFGPVLKPKSSRAKVGQWNPYYSVMMKASGEIRAIEAELGIAPTSRNRAGKAPNHKPRKWTAADEFLSVRR